MIAAMNPWQAQIDKARAQSKMTEAERTEEHRRGRMDWLIKCIEQYQAAISAHHATETDVSLNLLISAAHQVDSALASAANCGIPAEELAATPGLSEAHKRELLEPLL